MSLILEREWTSPYSAAVNEDNDLGRSLQGQLLASFTDGMAFELFQRTILLSIGCCSFDCRASLLPVVVGNFEKEPHSVLASQRDEVEKVTLLSLAC